MRPGLVFALFVSVSPALAQTNNGYVGVFGDAAGTIHCMQAQPGVPTILYVVAKTAGATANGIAGAEFRIEFSNPTGYFLSYTAPSNVAAMLGNPLNGVGINLAWSACQTPVNGILQLGTIFVFNTGSGGVSDIIVKRRNPPANENYQCASFMQCDAPEFTQSCMTAPADSVSCLNAKASALPAVLSGDEFQTSLEGSTASTTNKKYEQFEFFLFPHDMEMASGLIRSTDPAVTQLEEGVLVLVGLANDQSGLPFQRSVQVGWVDFPTFPQPQYFYELLGKDGNTQINEFEVFDYAYPVSTYTVQKNYANSNVDVLINGVKLNFRTGTSTRWKTYGPFCRASFGAEINNSPHDWTPGSLGFPCTISNMQVQAKNSAVCDSPLEPELSGFCQIDRIEDSDDGPNSAPNGHVEKTGPASIKIYDDRQP